MNNKGFTLVELLGVVALLAIIAAIAVPTVTGISGYINNNMLKKKYEIIEEAAVIYGQDVKKSVMNSKKRYSNTENGYNYNYPCISIKVKDLVSLNGMSYLDNDTEGLCMDNSLSEKGCIVNPVDSSKYLDLEEVIIYYKNKRMFAKVNSDNIYKCS